MAQRRTLAVIAADLAGPFPMHRLLQGDVGSGKTVVALAALLGAVQSGYQGALMVPTEVLAEQHAVAVRQMLGDLDVRVELLTSRVKGKARAAPARGAGAAATWRSWWAPTPSSPTRSRSSRWAWW